MISYERAVDIARLYYEDVYHFCYLRLENEDYAYEVTQDVFLIFQENCDGLDDSFIRAWLYKVADNKIKEKFREIARREKELIFGREFGTVPGADILLELEEAGRLTVEELDEKKKTVLESLNDKELELFEMVYVKHKKYKELAKALNISEHAIRTRVYRLNLKIKEKVSFIFMAVLLLFMKI